MLSTPLIIALNKCLYNYNCFIMFLHKNSLCLHVLTVVLSHTENISLFPIKGCQVRHLILFSMEGSFSCHRGLRFLRYHRSRIYILGKKQTTYDPFCNHFEQNDSFVLTFVFSKSKHLNTIITD